MDPTGGLRSSRTGTISRLLVRSVCPALLAGEFDLVYTGIGALCWLPDVREWAAVVAALLRPGGRLFIREGHPMLWSLSDPREDGLVAVEFPYFEVAGGIRFVEEHSYVEHEGVLASPDTVGFNHGIGEIINAVWDAGLTLTAFEEHMTVPWNPLGDAFVEEVSYVEHEGVLASPETIGFNHGLGEIINSVWDAGLTLTGFEEHRTVPWNPLGDAFVEVADLPGEYQLRDRPERLAATYTLQARKG